MSPSRSPFGSTARFASHVGPRASIVACLIGLTAACSGSEGRRGTEWLGDAAFGSPPPNFRPDGGDGSDNGDLDAESPNDNVKLRVFHGVLNVPGVRFCFDPDYRVDDPYTDQNEADPGAEPPVPILADLVDGGVLPLGADAGYVMLSLPSALGAITVHRATPPSNAGADGGSNNAPSDAGREAGADAAIDPCDPASIETVLPLPMPATWLDPPRPAGDAGSASGDASGGPSDAGLTSPERRGLLTTLSGDVPLTLFGSGRSLDPQRLMDRRAAARDAFLVRNPGDPAGAEGAGRAAVAWLESSLGPRFYLTRGVVPVNKNTTFGLTLVHLIPDVFASVDGGVPSDTMSGALHVCVRINTLEWDIAGGGITRVDFRNSLSFDPLDPGARYVFRLFVEADFVRTMATCGVTSLKPVAELALPGGYFEAGGSYTLVAWGARSASDLCTAFPSDSVVRPGCAGPSSNLNAQILVFDNSSPP